jgi:dTDP-4-amino-4,6-dideoxygalactose transaminase
MASEALDRIHSSLLSPSDKEFLSSVLLASQSLASENLESYTRLSQELPSLITSTENMEERMAWVKYTKHLSNKNETSRNNMDSLIERIRTEDLSLLLSEYRNI